MTKFLLVLIFVVVVSGIIEYFIAKTVKNAYKFKLYALRDDLSKLALGGIVDKNSFAYRFVRWNINAEIAYQNKITFSQYVESLESAPNPIQKDLIMILEDIMNDEYLSSILNSFAKIAIKKHTNRLKVYAVIFSVSQKVTHLFHKQKFNEIVKTIASGEKYYETLGSVCVSNKSYAPKVA